MNDRFTCDDKDTLIGYIYDEIDGEERLAVERHVRACTSCAREVDGLRAVRADLQAWQPPGTLAAPHAGRRAAWRARAGGPLPVWAQAAAAVLVLAAGLAVANIRVQSGPGGLTVTTGWMLQPALPGGTERTAAAGREAEDEAWRPALTALEQSLRAELAQLRQPRAGVTAATKSGDPAEAALLRRVQALINASERRQREETALRLVQATREWENQRRGDLMRIEQRLGGLQRGTFAVQAGQREVLNQLRRVSGQPIP
jgi:hypothetical protein